MPFLPRPVITRKYWFRVTIRTRELMMYVIGQSIYVVEGRGCLEPRRLRFLPIQFIWGPITRSYTILTGSQPEV